MTDNIVTTQNLWREFPKERNQYTLFQFIRKGRNNREVNRLIALQDISISIKQGEKIGLIGNNGSGKSTLIRLVAGLIPPTKGKVESNGEIALLSHLGVGMLDDLTVRDNVYLYGAIHGIQRSNVSQLYDEIIEWAELEGFSKSLLKTLSWGMQSRLAFSVTRHIQADIFLLDEALSAGDVHFREKINSYFEKQSSLESTYLIATHEMEFVSKYCTKVLWLHHGRNMAFGEPNEILAQYKLQKER
jgi:ABC-type polysaccharide/polyol phosphate transport system ATPase subunit